MELVALTEHLIKNIVRNRESVSVRLFDDTDDTVVIQVVVDDSDMGLVLGHGGATAHAIRTIVQASSYLKDNKVVKINFDAF